MWKQKDTWMSEGGKRKHTGSGDNAREKAGGELDPETRENQSGHLTELRFKRTSMKAGAYTVLALRP